MSSSKKSAERELKFNVPDRSLGNLKQILYGLCTKDDLYETTFVHSLYFDTSDFDFAMEKAASDYLKSKIRIRFYSSSADPLVSLDSKCYFEVKNKIGSVRDKQRITLDIKSYQLFQEQGFKDIQSLVDAKINELGCDVPGKVSPAFFVSYRRSRFKDLFSGSRIALDSDIVARATPQNKLGLANREFCLDMNVLEVKGTGKALPFNLRILTALDIKKFAFSKYYLCFQGLSNYQQ